MEGVSCQVIDVCYRRSLLVQGGSVSVTVDMDVGDTLNVQVLKYEDLVMEYYKEPENRMFNDVTALVLEALMSEDNDSDSESELGPEAEEN